MTRRLRKRHVKSEFALPHTLSRFYHLVYFVKCWQIFLELNSKGLYQSSGKEKESCCLVFPWNYTLSRCSRATTATKKVGNVQKSVMHVQGSCFANQNLLLFRSFRSSRCLRCLGSLVGQPRRQQQRNCRWKSEFALLQTLPRLLLLVQFVKCWHFFLELNSKRLYRSSGNEKESRCLVLTSSTTREIRNFHIVVMQWR